jgi:hypothetical protein
MANTLRFKRGLAAGLPVSVAGEPLFTTDTFDLYIGTGSTNQQFQKYIASGTTLQYLRGDGSLATFPTITNGTVTSVAATAGTGITISGSPITTSGTLTITNSAPDQVVTLTGAGATTISGTYPNFTITSVISGTGTVTSVDLSVPTGLTVSGNPITTSGTLAIALASGYVIPTTSNATNWDAAYNDKINSAAVTGTTTKTLTLNQQDGGTITASWTDDNTDAVTSVFGRTGAVVATGGDYTTSQVTEVTNLYYTEGRVSANTDVAANTAARHNAVTLGTANGLSLNTQALSLGLSSASATGALSSTDWSTFNSKQIALNGTGFVKISGTTISYDNSTYYLSSNPSAYISLTSLSAGAGISYNNTTGVITSTITQYTDTLARLAISETVTGLDYNNTTGVLSLTSGYVIPTTSSATNWDSAYNDKIVSAAVSGTTTKTLTLTQQDAGTITASWTDDNTDAVTSVFGRTGAVIATSGDYTTTLVTEGTNLYYTDTRARAALSFVAGSGAYNSTTGVITIPTNNNQITNGAGYTTNVGTVTSVDLSVPTGLSVSGNPITTSGTLAITLASGYVIPTQTTLDGKVPYTGATGDVNLGTHRILAQNATIASTGSGDTATINHTSGSGISLNITKGGNGEGLYINKTSGSGNAATIIGTLNATTLVKSGGTSSQFLKADGSVDSTAYGTGSVTSVAALTLGTTGTDLSSTVANGTTTPVITLQVPTASAANRGALSSADWTTFNNKEGAIAAGTTAQYYRGDKTFQTLNTLAVPESTNLYFTEDRVRGTVLTGLNLASGGTIAAADNVLQAFGKVQNQISALVGGVMYEGTWNANTNSPTITSGTGSKGDYYVVSTAGATSIDGITDWKIGDWIIFNGTVWDKVDNTDAVSSVNGYTGTVSLVTGDVLEGAGSLPSRPSQLYFTDARARAALSAGTGISYNSTTGVITNSSPDQTVSITASSGISVSGTYPSFTVASTITQYTDALARAAISLTVSGSSGASTYNNTTGVLNVPTYTLSGLGGVPTTRSITINGTAQDLSADRTFNVGTVTSVAALTLGTTGTDVSSSVANGTTTPVITLNIPTASAANRGALSSADWTTFNNKQGTITLTTTGTSGAATFSSNTLNIPNYAPDLSGYVTLATNQTISGAKTFSAVVTATSGVYVGSGTAGRNAFSQGDFRIAAPNDANILNCIAANASMTIKSDNYGGGSATPLILQSGGNTNQVYLATSGGVGIGTDAPSALLTVSSVGFDDTYFRVEQRRSGYASAINLVGANDAGAAYNRISSQTNGGTTHWQIGGGAVANTMVLYTGGTPRLTIASTGAATFSAGVKVNGTPAATSGILSVVTSTSTLGATADLGLLISNDGSAGKLAQIGFGYSESRSAAVIGGVISNGAGATTSDLFFATRSTTTGSDAPTERMRIFSDGNVLIQSGGTFTNAGFKLDVNGTGRFSGSGSNGYLYVSGNAGSGGSTNPAYLQGMNFSWNKSNGGGESLLTYTNQGGGSNIRFGIGYWNNTTYSEQFTILSNGNVGIGTTSPSAILHTSVTTNGTSVGALFANPNQAGTADAVSINFGLGRTADALLFSIPAIKFGKEQQWTSTGSTVDGYLSFSTMLNESVSERMRITSGGVLQIANSGGTLGSIAASERLNVNGDVYSYGAIQAATAIAIGTTPDTNVPFKILKNINATVGIHFQNTSTSSLAFSAIQLGTDVTGATAFTNLVYASSGITESGVYKKSGTSLINTGAGGLNFLSVSQPIRFFTSSGNGTLRAEIANDGFINHFTGTAPSTNATDGYRQYSADVVAGNAAPHFRTENGAVIKLYQETTGVGSAFLNTTFGATITDTDTFDGYTLQQVIKALRNQGILQ